jgi:hypothetical protein
MLTANDKRQRILPQRSQRTANGDGGEDVNGKRQTSTDFATEITENGDGDGGEDVNGKGNGLRLTARTQRTTTETATETATTFFLSTESPEDIGDTGDTGDTEDTEDTGDTEINYNSYEKFDGE